MYFITNNMINGFKERFRIDNVGVDFGTNFKMNVDAIINDKERKFVKCCDVAVYCNRIDLLEIAINNRRDYDTITYLAAIDINNIKILKYLGKEKMGYKKTLLRIALLKHEKYGTYEEIIDYLKD